ncbi:hypothetical protein OPV22_019419 [Ensete ventricosum]|uniref:Pectin acetylesterase n=1 Tax=Ensete ventricosum TaxID=4639 RepID=A0AAV8QBX5_ENSVE|nr:hypothetical protein OPV22_019419 [Ensete ventricosum]
MKATRVLLLCLLGLLTALGVAAGYQLRKRPGGSGTVKGSVAPSGAPPLLVNLTLIPSAAAQGAVCLDGTVPGYHLHPGFGSGANSWVVNLEGGGWCNNGATCRFSKNTIHGSSNYMEKQVQFSGISSNKPEENPDFYNWNRVYVRYCDGASFTGEGYDAKRNLYFRGQRIWSAVMEELMSKGMRSAEQALLSGCSAGGLASILHCDEFRALFPQSTKVKCLADAGFFLDAVDVGGGRSLRSFYQGVATLHGVASTLPKSCTSRMDATSCFFPENIVPNITTPTFILNAAYDVWQIQRSLAPGKADPTDYWKACKFNHLKCDSKQIQFLQGFRNEMLNALQGFSQSTKNGLFINSCFAHCQAYNQDTWYGDDSPTIGKKRIATSVGDWYFERSKERAIDCAYPCDNTCHHLF